MMSIPSQEPNPLLAPHTTSSTTTYQHGNADNIIIGVGTSPTLNLHLFKNSSARVKYMECLKNQAVAIGGNATDGCGEFMAGGEEGTIEALKCSACNCHRNFHRKTQIRVEASTTSIMRTNTGVYSSAEIGLAHEGGGKVKKRFRTKFTEEQKEKMLGFAVRAGWKLTEVDDSEVRRFCEEVGVNRKVLKVWMRNNVKHHFAKKNKTPSTNI